MVSKSILKRGCLIALTAWCGSGALAQSYPNRPITIVVPTGTGGGVDLVARLVGTRLSESVKQPVVIDNRPGAGNALGSEIVARSAPDGYTLVLANNSSHGVNQAFRPNLSYDTVKDFTPIVLIAGSPNMLLTRPSIPANNVKEFVALAKAKPGQFNFGSSGLGSQTHLSGELFKYVTGINIVHVPYKGTAPAYVGLIGGEVQLLFGTAAGSMPHVQSGKIKAIALTGEKRLPAMPDLQTLSEQGIKGFETGAWYALLGPAGVPRPIVLRLNQEVVKIVNTADFKQKLAAASADPMGGTPEECADVIRKELEKWTRLRKETHIVIE